MTNPLSTAQDQDLVEKLTQFFKDLFAGDETAMAAFSNPDQALFDAGIDPAALNGALVSQAYTEACNSPGVPEAYKGALNSYTAPPTVHQVVREVQQIQVTEIHQDIDQTFNDYSETIDSSVKIGDVDTGGGTFDFDQQNVSGTGGSVVGGNDAVGATGAGSAASDEGDAAASGGVNSDIDYDFGGGKPPAKDPDSTDPSATTFPYDPNLTLHTVPARTVDLPTTAEPEPPYEPPYELPDINIQGGGGNIFGDDNDNNDYTQRRDEVDAPAPQKDPDIEE